MPHGGEDKRLCKIRALFPEKSNMFGDDVRCCAHHACIYPYCQHRPTCHAATPPHPRLATVTVYAPPATGSDNSKWGLFGKSSSAPLFTPVPRGNSDYVRGHRNRIRVESWQVHRVVPTGEEFEFRRQYRYVDGVRPHARDPSKHSGRSYRSNRAHHPE